MSDELCFEFLIVAQVTCSGVAQTSVTATWPSSSTTACIVLRRATCSVGQSFVTNDVMTYLEKGL